MRLLLKRLLSYIPMPVPTGMTKFDAFVADIVLLSDGIASANDIEWVVNAEMMRIGPRQSRISKNYFVASIKSAAAKQLAGARFQALKLKQQAEVTAQSAVAVDEPKG